MGFEIIDKYGKKHVFVISCDGTEVENIIPKKNGRYSIYPANWHGFLCTFNLDFHSNTAYIHDIKLRREDMKRTWIGTGVITFLEGELRKIGVEKIVGEISKVDKETAPLFWKKLGYTLIEYPKGGWWLYKIEKLLSR